ncbi:MAG: phosphatidylglycerophosphatase A [Deltaproteobacteria bacterium]|jgi:phosphatidylglycerophosphatase A|nr:phosphatidylglycerophosphatase A [Deltaproteobacteria bacterium]
MPPDSARSPLPVRLLYTWFGLGYAPKAPGTFGTAGAIPLYFLVVWLGGLAEGSGGIPGALLGGWKLFAAATVLVFLAGWWACARGEADFGGHDDKRMVIDEVLGYMMTMFPLPLSEPLPFSWLWGFALFRLFDIWKPGFVGAIDRRVPGGLGVMLDDAAAGALAWVCLQVLGRVWGPAFG